MARLAFLLAPLALSFLHMMSGRFRIHRSDLLLALAALIGGLLFVLLLPHQHPDQAIPFPLHPDSARTAAERFLRAHGYETEGLQSSIFFRRTPEFLELLGQQYGRMELVRRLRASAENVPAYSWEVSWRTSEGAALSEPQQGQERLRLFLTPSGIPWRLEYGASSFPLSPAPALDPDSIRQLAHSKLTLTLWGQLGWKLDSVSAGPDGGYRISGFCPLPLLRDSVRIMVHLSAEGRLLELRPQWPPVRAGSRNGQVGLISTLIVYVILGVSALVVFLRRLYLRMIDVPLALTVGLIGSVLAALAILLPMIGSVSDLPPDPLLRLIPVLLSFFFAALGGGGVFFILVAAGETLSPRLGPERLRSLRALARGNGRSPSLAHALMRGAAGSLALAGLGSLILSLFPEAPVAFGTETAQVRWAPSFIRPYALFALGASGWMGGMIILLSLPIGTGLLWRLWPHRAVLLLAPALLWIGMGSNPTGFSVQSEIAMALLSGIAGLTVGWLFYRHDILTAWLAYWGASLLWHLHQIGLPRSGLFLWDGLFLLLFPLLIGGVGWLLGRQTDTSEDDTQYLPPYVVELARRERLERELEIARQLQLSLLPQRTPERAGLEIAAHCEPALEVGGDYYDFCELDAHRIGVLIGDVSGKGIPAAFYMTLVKGLMQSLCQANLPPTDTLERLNHLFCRHARRGVFLSMLYGILDLWDGTFTFARAGHTPLLLYRRRLHRVQTLRPRGMAIGLTTDDRFRNHLQQERLLLEPGDVLLLYTDGLSEARNRRNELLEESTLHGVILAHAREPARVLMEHLLRTARAFEETAPRADDRTLIVLRILQP
jgi:sigma-B regulation protein RsbU (phosphoserine phosphatase)